MVNQWIKYVKAFQKKNNIKKYGDALKLAGPSYRKQCGLSPKHKTKKHKKKSPKKRRRSNKKKKRSKKTA